MKKTILILTITSAVASSMLFADALTDVAVSKVTAEAKTEVVKQVVDATGVSGDVVKQAAKVVSSKEGAAGAVTGGGSMTDKAVDMAVEKTIGDNAMAKDVAKKAVNAVIK